MKAVGRQSLRKQKQQSYSNIGMTSAHDSDFSHAGFTLGYVTETVLQASISDFFKGEERDQLGKNTQLKERKDTGTRCTKSLYLM